MFPLVYYGKVLSYPGSWSCNSLNLQDCKNYMNKYNKLNIVNNFHFMNNYY